MLKQACPEEILNQGQNDTFRVQHDIFKHFTIYDTVSWGERRGEGLRFGLIFCWILCNDEVL